MPHNESINPCFNAVYTMLKIFNMTENRIQQECFMWFHNTHPEFRGLYFEIHNEQTGISIKWVQGVFSDVLKNPSKCTQIVKSALYGFKKQLGMEGARRTAIGRIPGVADNCLLLKNGRCCFFEFKTEKGKQSESQIKWQNKIAETGHDYFLVRDKAHFILLINNLIDLGPLNLTR